MRKKLINIFLVILLFISFIISYLIFLGFENTKKELVLLNKSVNLLNIERDFEIYRFFTENNITSIKKNLDLNFMFHLSSIEKDNIENIVDIQSISRLCLKYKVVNEHFKIEYKDKYPLSIQKFDKLCQ